jgi:hypothetical protein
MFNAAIDWAACYVTTIRRQRNRVPATETNGAPQMNFLTIRDRLGRLSGGLHLSRRSREDDVDIHANQLSRQLRQLVDRFRPPELDDNVLAFDIAELAQAGP